MPRVSEKTLEKQKATILKMASRKDGVTLPEITDKLGISRPYADKLVKEIGLASSEKDGRANVYRPSGDSSDQIRLTESKPKKAASGRKIELDDEEVATSIATPSVPVTSGEVKALEFEVAKLSALLALKQARLSAHYSK